MRPWGRCWPRASHAAVRPVMACPTAAYAPPRVLSPALCALKSRAAASRRPCCRGALMAASALMATQVRALRVRVRVHKRDLRIS
jgi:hypothetical protein